MKRILRSELKRILNSQVNFPGNFSEYGDTDAKISTNYIKGVSTMIKFSKFIVAC